MSLAAILPNIALRDSHYLDYVPVASTVFNVYCMYLKATQNALEEANLHDHNYTYLKDKPYWRCIFLLVPGIGNIFILILDSFTCCSRGEKSSSSAFLQNPALVNNENHREDRLIERLRQDGMQLQNLSDEERDNPRYIRIAVKQNGLSLQFASANRQDENAIVHLALEENPKAIQYASPRLQNKPEIIISLRWDGLDREIGEKIIGVDGMRLQDASESLRDDWSFVSKAVSKKFDAFKHASDRLKQDQNVLKTMIGLAGQDEAKVKALLSINGLALEFALPEHQNNESIVKIATQQNFRAYNFASNNLRKNREIIDLTRGQVLKTKIFQNNLNLEELEGQYGLNVNETRTWFFNINDTRPAQLASIRARKICSINPPPIKISFRKGFEFVINMIKYQMKKEPFKASYNFAPSCECNGDAYIALLSLRHLPSNGQCNNLPTTCMDNRTYVSWMNVIFQVLIDKGFIKEAKQEVKPGNIIHYVVSIS